MSPSTVALSPEEESEALAALSVAFSDWHGASRDAAAGGVATPDPPDWLPQMRCIVQAGVPKVSMGAWYGSGQCAADDVVQWMVPGAAVVHADAHGCSEALPGKANTARLPCASLYSFVRVCIKGASPAQRRRQRVVQSRDLHATGPARAPVEAVHAAGPEEGRRRVRPARPEGPGEDQVRQTGAQPSRSTHNAVPRRCCARPTCLVVDVP